MRTQAFFRRSKTMSCCEPINLLPQCGTIVLSALTYVITWTIPSVIEFLHKMCVTEVSISGQFCLLRIIMIGHSNATTITTFHIKAKHGGFKHSAMRGMIFASICIHRANGGIWARGIVFYCGKHIIIDILREKLLTGVVIASHSATYRIWSNNNTQPYCALFGSETVKCWRWVSFVLVSFALLPTLDAIKGMMLPL